VAAAGQPIVALDAMGGEHAPSAAVAAALRAEREHGVTVRLVGERGRLAAELSAHHADDRLRIVSADSVVGMDEDPAVAVRGKRDSSIRVAAQSLADGQVHAVASAGSTGSTLAAALLTLGRLDGVRRPAVAALVPTPAGEVVLIDAGASADVPAAALSVYARMGAAYAKVLGREPVRVGLLNVAEEAGKGNELARAAYEDLVDDAHFAGNVEPDAALAGAVDVVVTDGFTGNVFLKTLEASRGEAGGTSGGAVLLGVTGVVVAAHGSADEHQIAGAVALAGRAVTGDLTTRLAEQMAAAA
jgi:glycerol-3-phosphate acyltransferase PlsX